MTRSANISQPKEPATMSLPEPTAYESRLAKIERQMAQLIENQQIHGSAIVEVVDRIETLEEGQHIHRTTTKELTKQVSEVQKTHRGHHTALENVTKQVKEMRETPTMRYHLANVRRGVQRSNDGERTAEGGS